MTLFSLFSKLLTAWCLVSSCSQAWLVSVGSAMAGSAFPPMRGLGGPWAMAIWSCVRCKLAAFPMSIRVYPDRVIHSVKQFEKHMKHWKEMHGWYHLLVSICIDNLSKKCVCSPFSSLSSWYHLRLLQSSQVLAKSCWPSGPKGSMATVHVMARIQGPWAVARPPNFICHGSKFKGSIRQEKHLTNISRTLFEPHGWGARHSCLDAKREEKDRRGMMTVLFIAPSWNLSRSASFAFYDGTVSPHFHLREHSEAFWA